MKNKILKVLNWLLAVLVLITLFGCKSNDSPINQGGNNNEPPKVETKTLTYKYYTLEDDVTDLSFLEGYPWLNTSVEGVMAKIKRPSLKDDFYAYSNYEYLKSYKLPSNKNKYGGLLFDGDTLTDERLLKIINDTNSSLSTINRFITNGDLSGVKADVEASMNYTQTDIENLFKTKDLFYGSFAQLELLDKDNDAIYVSLSENYTDSLLLAYYYAYYYGGADDFINGLNDIKEAEGINISDFKEFAGNTLRTVMPMYLDIFNNPITHYETTVGEVNNVFTGLFDVKPALKDLGFSDNKRIIYDNATLAFLSSLENYCKTNSYELIRNIITLSKILYYRYYIGTNNYLTLYKDKLSKNPYFYDEDILPTVKDSELSLKIIEKRFYALLSNEYCSKFANNSTREVVSGVINEIVNEYKLLLQENDWLGEETKHNAIEKLENMFSITYYEDGLLQAPSFSSNKDSLINLDKDYNKYFLSYYDLINYEIIKAMAPYTTNAIYYCDYNGFMITHGIVSAFIDKNLSTEEIYGAIGAVIGHEISHGFDSNGGQYDKDGNYSDWWAEEDKNTFKTKVKKIVDLYDNNIFSFNGSRLNGSLVNGEVTADMGGMRVILRLAAKKADFDYKKLFESYAKFFSYVYSYDKGLSDTKDNPHPLSYLRVNLTLAQFDEFQQAYDIKEGDGMYIKKEDRVAIW